MNILVYTQNWGGYFKKITWELVSWARALANQTSGELHALSIGEVADDELKKLGTYGADHIISVNGDAYQQLDTQAYGAAIAQAAGQKGAKVVVFANDFTGKAVAPRVAARMQAAMAAGVNALPESTEPLRLRKKAFSGKAYATVEMQNEVCVLSLEPNTYEVVENQKESAIEELTPELPAGHVPTKVTATDKVTDQILLTDADIVVSGGRGMKGPEHWQPLEELASTLGAATACSRPVSDEGWRPEEEHVGQTGKIIAPNLYIALGISGAIQHLAGVSGSKVMVAVNKDPEAPVFEAADYGIVGDLKEELPKLIEAAKHYTKGE